MKTMTKETLKMFTDALPALGTHAEEHRWVHPDTQTEMLVRQCPQGKAAPGDLMVRYGDRDVVALQYRRAIRVLALDEKVEKRLIDFDRLEALRSDLTRIAGRIHLWEYAPEDRDAVKAARLYIQTLLGATIPFGQKIIIPAEEMTSFLRDAKKNFAVSAYYYCQEPAVGIAVVEEWVERAKRVESRARSVSKSTLESLSESLAHMVPVSIPFNIWQRV